MLAFFRRILKNWWVGAIFALVAIAIVVTGVGTPGGGGGLFGGGGGAPGSEGEAIAKMKGGVVTAQEVQQRAQLLFQDAKQQSPSLDMAGFIAQGGADAAVRGVVTSRAIELWATRQGLQPSERQIDGEIASISAFNGPDGKFDRRAFLALIAQRHITEKELRQQIGGDIVRRQLLSPVAGGARSPMPLVSRYSAMLLEKRTGSVALVPTTALPAAAPPGDAEIQAYYRKNLPRYSLPERRVIRYAPIGLEQVAALAKPSDAEIAAYYRAHATDYAAREERAFSRLVFPTETAATAFAAKVRGGAGFAAAAQAAGFAAKDTIIGKQTQTALAGLASPQVATAAFALPQGGVTDPVKAPLGWFVVRADQVTKIAAKTLDAARPEIAATLAKQKGETALADLVNRLQTAIDGGAIFDDVVRKGGLVATATPPVVAGGAAPTDPAFRLAPGLQGLLKPAFDAEPDDEATIETLGQDRYALLKLGQVIPGAARPLAEIREAVAHDIQQEKGSLRARAIADAIAAKASGGISLAAAVAGAGMPLPPTQTASIRQFDLARLQQQGRQVPPPLTALFRLLPGKTLTIPAQGGAGWFIVRLDKIEPGPPADIAPLAAASRREFDDAFSAEIAEQFANATVKAADVEENRAAVARLKAKLAGSPAATE